VHDRQSGQTTRVSVASDGMQGNGPTSDLPYQRAAISGDGRYVAFASAATNLVPSDTNAATDVFVHDLQTGQTIRVSVASDGTPANQRSAWGYESTLAISRDGRYIAFASAASNLISDDTNARDDIFLYDRLTHQTTRISIASIGTQGDDYSDEPTISGDGRFVAFSSRATNLVLGDTNSHTDIFIHDRGSVERIYLPLIGD
jgi:Tol biopolymer transport system component